MKYCLLNFYLSPSLRRFLSLGGDLFILGQINDLILSPLGGDKDAGAPPRHHGGHHAPGGEEDCI